MKNKDDVIFDQVVALEGISCIISGLCNQIGVGALGIGAECTLTDESLQKALRFTSECIDRVTMELGKTLE